jgi:hypothetical protein
VQCARAVEGFLSGNTNAVVERQTAGQTAVVMDIDVLMALTLPTALKKRIMRINTLTKWCLLVALVGLKHACAQVNIVPLVRG